MRRSLFQGFLLAGLLAVSATAQTTFIWSGAGGNANFFTPGNWQGGVAPAGNPTDRIIFPNLPLTLDELGNFNATVGSPISLGNLTFNGQYYSFYLFGTGPITLNGNITAHNVGTIGVAIVLAAGNHIIDGTSQVFQSGDVSGSGSLTVNGANLAMSGLNNSYSGGTTLNGGGQLYGYRNNTFGTGTVTLNNGTLNIHPSGGAVRLANNFVLGANVRFYTTNQNGTAGIGDASHTIAPAAGVSTVNLQLLYGDAPLYLSGAMINGSSPTTYTFENVGGNSVFHLNGNNTYTGGTLVKDGGTVLFETAGAIPASGLISAYVDGYAGVANNAFFPTFLSRIDPVNFTGTIGLDSGAPYAGNIDLSNFTSFGSLVALGTLGTAELSGLITPSSSGTSYRFRSSGTLYLTGSNPLSGNNSVRSGSFINRDRGLLVLSQSVPNTYTGAAVADGGGIVFDSAGSKPAGTGIELRNGGYVGFTETSGLTLGDLVGAVTVQAGSPGVLGIDTHATIVNGDYNTPYTYSPAIDLGNLPNPAYLGSASRVTVTGSIDTTDDDTDDYYLTGYRSGTLTVNSQLSGSKSVNVGLPGLNQFGTVVLNNVTNTYSAGTVINSGGLLVAAPGSLGPGPITVNAAESYQSILFEGPFSATLPNNIILASGELSLFWGNSILSGVISGSGSLLVQRDVTLTGANSYSGGTVVDFVQLTGTTNTALGTGGLSVNNGATVALTSTAPQIGSLIQGGLFDNGDGTLRTATIVLTNPGGGTFTINQTEEGDFDGIIAQSGASPFSLVKNGPGTLTISGNTEDDNNYTTPYGGGTTINGGRLVAGSVNAFGPGTITINGGELGMTPGVILNNPIAFGGSGGKLNGNGTFATLITVGPNVTLSPGNSPGILTFSSGLTLAGGGNLEFEVQSAAGLPGTGYDLVNISAGLLNITATTGSKFTIKLTSLDFFGAPGNVYDFSSGSGYSWLLFQGNAVSGISGFAANKFDLDLTGFTNGLAGGTFSLSQGVYAGNPSLYLNFTPVPEPSTWLLMGSGLAALVAAARRRRHA